MNHDAHEEEEDRIPRFECRLPIPEGVAPGVRTLIEQADINRQLTELLFSRASRALKIANAAEKRIAKTEERIAALEAFQWKATWIAGVALVIFEIALRYFPAK